MKQTGIFSKTIEYLNRYDALYQKLCSLDIQWKDLKDEERYIVDYPMLHLAEILCDETKSDSSGGMAVDLAKFILIITGAKA